MGRGCANACNKNFKLSPTPKAKFSPSNGRTLIRRKAQILQLRNAAGPIAIEEAVCGADASGCCEAKAVKPQAAYFESHCERMRYDRVREAGCPVGSGAMESTCAQMPGRFKRPGQFWSDEGQCLQMELARRNEDWNEIWSIAA